MKREEEEKKKKRTIQSICYNETFTLIGLLNSAEEKYNRE